MFRQLIYILLLLCVIFAFAVSFAFSQLIPIPYWELFINELIHAVIFSMLAILIFQITKYGNYAALSMYQRVINYIAIGVLTIGIWLAAGYGVFYLLFGETKSILIQQTCWMKGIVGTLLYLFLIQYFYYHQSENETVVDTEEYLEEKQNESISTIVQKEILERIAIKSGQKIHVILVPEIIYLQAEGDYVKIYTENGKYLKEETMKYFQEHLPAKQFVRVHRSYIVNVEMIQRINVYEKQNQLVTLKNGDKIKASLTGYKQLKSILNL